MLEKLKYNEAGLIPTVVQDVSTKEVLMMAWMNKVSLEKTITSGETWFFSRSRQKLWHKGETSGHVQKVKELYYDCDGDTLLVLVEQEGAACHEGYKSCFHYRINADSSVTITGEKIFNPDQIYGEKKEMDSSIIEELYNVILQRQEERPVGAYTTYLFDQGIDKICKKIGEEAAEVIIGAKNRSKEEVVYESADLIYHLLVLLAEQGVKPDDIFQELASRRK